MTQLVRSFPSPMDMTQRRRSQKPADESHPRFPALNPEFSGEQAVFSGEEQPFFIAADPIPTHINPHLLQSQPPPPISPGFTTQRYPSQFETSETQTLFASDGYWTRNYNDNVVSDVKYPYDNDHQAVGLAHDPDHSSTLSTGYDMKMPDISLADYESGFSPISQPNAPMTSSFDGNIAPVLADERSGEPKFRFHVWIDAATAMPWGKSVSPITYLDKSQLYSIHIEDTSPPQGLNIPTSLYRTYVQVSFDDEPSRIQSDRMWQSWLDGRGKSEAHERDGRMQAVEFCYLAAGANENNQANIQLQSEFFDGFCFTWSSNREGNPKCTVGIKFRFLSTDFSSGKGAKGISMRLSAKTELLDAHDVTQSHLGSPCSEISFCKVKVFRDNGAERKIQNDMVARLKQTEKNRRVRGAKGRHPADSLLNLGPAERLKNKESCSTCSKGFIIDTPGDSRFAQSTADEDMGDHRSPFGVFHLRGEEEDNPDKHSVQHTTDQLGLEGGGTAQRDRLQNSLGPLKESSSVSTQKKCHECKVKHQMQYSALPTRVATPVTCFYVRIKIAGTAKEAQFHRAIYLLERTLMAFVSSIAFLCDFDTAQIENTVRIDNNGRQINVDDETIKQLPEGQHMVAEVCCVDITLVDNCARVAVKPKYLLKLWY